MEAKRLPIVMPDFSEENLARLQAATDFRCGQHCYKATAH